MYAVGRGQGGGVERGLRESVHATGDLLFSARVFAR